MRHKLPPPRREDAAKEAVAALADQLTLQRLLLQLPMPITAV